MAPLLATAMLVLRQPASHLRGKIHVARQHEVALVIELRQCLLTRGTTGITRDERDVTFADRAVGPGQVIVHRHWPAIVAVDPDEGYVQVVTREIEVVG